MTFKEIYEQVQDIVDDTSGAALLRIKRAINRGQETLVAKLPASALHRFITKQTGTTTSDINEYDVIANDFVKPLSVVIEKGGLGFSCRYIPISQIPSVSHEGNKTAQNYGPYFSYYGTTLIFAPDIDSAYDYEFWYINEPADLYEDNDVPYFPLDLHNLLVEYACARYFEREQDSQAGYHRQLFTSGLAEAINFYGQYNQPAFIDPPEVESEL